MAVQLSMVIRAERFFMLILVDGSLIVLSIYNGISFLRPDHYSSCSLELLVANYVTIIYQIMIRSVTDQSLLE